MTVLREEMIIMKSNKNVMVIDRKDRKGRKMIDVHVKGRLIISVIVVNPLYVGVEEEFLVVNLMNEFFRESEVSDDFMELNINKILSVVNLKKVELNDIPELIINVVGLGDKYSVEKMVS